MNVAMKSLHLRMLDHGDSPQRHESFPISLASNWRRAQTTASFSPLRAGVLLLVNIRADSHGRDLSVTKMWCRLSGSGRRPFLHIQTPHSIDSAPQPLCHYSLWTLHVLWVCQFRLVGPDQLCRSRNKTPELHVTTVAQWTHLCTPSIPSRGFPKYSPIQTLSRQFPLNHLHLRAASVMQQNAHT